MKHSLHIKIGTVGSFTNSGIKKLCSEITKYVPCLSHGLFGVLGRNILIIYNNNYQSCFLSENIRNILISV